MRRKLSPEEVAKSLWRRDVFNPAHERAAKMTPQLKSMKRKGEEGYAPSWNVSSYGAPSSGTLPWKYRHEEDAYESMPAPVGIIFYVPADVSGNIIGEKGFAPLPDGGIIEEVLENLAPFLGGGLQPVWCIDERLYLSLAPSFGWPIITIETPTR